jgi:hypothetical protein
MSGMQGGGVFSQRAVALLCAVGLLCFSAAALVAIYADPQTESTSGANAYSRSAIGHKAWTEILQKLGTPVLLSRGDSALKAYEGDGLLVLAQPDPTEDALTLLETFSDTDRVLLVLPKWRGVPDFQNPRWLRAVAPLDAAAVEEVLHVVDEEAQLVRSEGTPGWKSIAWETLPQLSDPQLIRSDEISPIVYSDDGILLGEYDVWGTKVWVLADPDVINNSGIDEGANAAFAVALVEELLPGGGAAVFDETIHGFALTPDLWKALLSFPLNLAVLQALAAAALLVWAAGGRFGAPLPPRPRLGAGKDILIDNTASLFQYSGRLTDILWRYREACLRDLGRHIHLPRDLDRPALVRWLDQVGAARGARQRYSEVDREVTAVLNGPAGAVPQVLRAALHLHRWKQEMVHGHRADPVGLRPDSGAGAQDRGGTGHRP